MSKKILALVALFTFGFAFAASAEITKSSRNSRDGRTEIQEALNACGADPEVSEDGVFGPKTRKAIKAFQSDNDLTADGVVGAQTAAALNDCFDGEEDAVEEDDSTTNTTSTEALCPNGMTLASNCTTAPASTTTTTTATLSGPEGNLNNITRLGSYSNTKVSESDKDVKVYGIELTAKDGDQKIDGLNLAFYNSNGSSSKKFTKYASEVSVWLDGVEIGRKLASQFSDDASDVYTYRFSGMNGVMKVNQKSQLIVAISAVSSMDSTDATNEQWYVEAGSANNGSTNTSSNTNYISAASANGRYRDFGSDLSNTSIDFQKAGGVSSDQKYKVTTSSTSPVAQTVQVSTTSDTSDKVLLAFDVKAENGAMVVQKLPITLTTTGDTTDGVLPFTNALVKSLKLYANGTKIADESVPQDGTDSVSEVIIFGNSSKLAYKIDNNATVKFEVRADLNDTENTGVQATDFDNGDKIKADYTSTNVTNSTIELDNANQDTVSNRTGSASGEDQTLRSTGVQVTMGSATTEATANQSGEILTRTISVPVTVKAFDETMYVSQAALNAATTASTEAMMFTLEDAAGATKVITNSATWTSTDATVEGSAYRIDSGSTKNFKLTVVLTGTTAHAQKQYRVQLNKVNAYTNSALSTGQSLQDLTPSNSFESAYYTLNLN